jgi:hypothetical protein
MLFASAGYLSPVAGALTQKIIDVLAVLNTLRATVASRDLIDFCDVDRRGDVGALQPVASYNRSHGYRETWDQAATCCGEAKGRCNFAGGRSGSCRSGGHEAQSGGC